MGLGNKVVDLAGNALKFADKFGLTQKERAEGMLEYYKTTLGENTTRSKTRRFIAVLIVSDYLFLVNLSVVLRVLDFKEKAAFTLEAANTSMGIAFIMVLTFFFGGYYMNKMKGNK